MPEYEVHIKYGSFVNNLHMQAPANAQVSTILKLVKEISCHLHIPYPSIHVTKHKVYARSSG